MSTHKQPTPITVYAAKALRRHPDLLKASQEQARKDDFRSWSEFLRAVLRMHVEGKIVVKPATLEVKK